jgi:hypothetical protein
MLSIHDAAGARLCDGLSRREWLKIGGLGLGGLLLPELLQARTRSGAAAGKAKSVIIMCLLGGPPQHETWDPKPDARPRRSACSGPCAPTTTRIPPAAIT